MKTKRILFIITLLLTAISGIKAQEQYSGNVVANEGAWCWFADPRALHYENVAGTINATYLGYIDVHGNVMATQYDWVSHRKTDVLVRSYFQPDDHNNPTFVVLPDERVMIFYTRHTDEAKIWYRISKKPGDITSLGEEKYLATANNTTYPSPFILSDDPTHIYLCWRGINWHPTIARLTMPDANDNCQFDFGPKQIVQSTGARPYAKYQSNGKDRIYLSYTTGHPDNEMPDWLYFNVIDINHGNGPILRDIKGTELKKVAEGVFNVNKQNSYASSYPLTVVDNTSNIRNWVWQIALDENENPVIAYPHIDNDKTTHVYWYARWTGTEWRRTWVQYGGHAFHKNWNSTERCYSGGMSLDPDNINDLYLSIPTAGGEYSKDGVYEIWKYTINDAGEVAGKEQITKNSTKNNIRPYFIPGSKNSPMRLAWMNGDYYYWMVNKNYPLGYPTDIRCNYAWEEELTPEVERQTEEPELPEVTYAVNQTLTIGFVMDEAKYEGTLFRIGEREAGGPVLEYSLGTDNYPIVTIDGISHRSQNRLLTSDAWAANSTGTSGDNHPTKVKTWIFTMTFDGSVLTIYRNGLVDQVIQTDALVAGDITTEGSNHSIAYMRCFNAVASPVTVQALNRQALAEIEAERRKQLPTTLLNGDFEGSYKAMENSGVTSDRAIYVPNGWSINYTSRDVNDLSALQAGDLYFDQFFGNLAKPASHGNRTYWLRQKWGGSTITLNQEMILPEGNYTLSMDLWKSGLGGDAVISVNTEGGATVTAPSKENMTAWQEVSLNFRSDGEAITTVSLSAFHNSDGSEKIIGWDNLVITKKEDTDPISAETFNFRLRNSLGIDRTDETVVVSVPAGTNPTVCALTDEDGNLIPFEVTALGGSDAEATAIRFQATVPAGATKGYTLAEGTPTAPAKLTYAAVKSPSSRDDIAWENDLSAYRMYSSRLLSSEPNTAQGVDVWSKKMATPVIDAMYNLSNYHNESQYGVDAYSVNGKRLGCGGVAVVENGHLVMHDPYNSCSITSNGALSSAFTLIYDNVKAGSATYTETLNVETQAGALLNRGTVRLDGAAGTLRLAVALYQHTDMSHTVGGVAFTGEQGLIGWADNKSEGSVTSANARFFQGAYVPAEANPRTEVIDNHLCLTFDYVVGTEQTFYFGAGWNIFPAGRYATDDDWFDALELFRDKTLSPLTCTSMAVLPTKTEVIDILNTVNQTWQEKHPTHGDYFWNRAVYHIGNMAAYEATGDGVYRDFSTAWAERNNWWGSTGTDRSKWKSTYGEGPDYVLFGDNQVCFQVYADLYACDPEHDANKIARAREVMEYEMSTAKVDYLWWVDGLFMVMPIMTKLHNITGNQTYLDKMYQYWQYANGIMYDNETGLYFRDAKYVYPAHTTNSGKKDFWARGDGWIFAAFAKVLSELPETDSHRNEYVTYYRRMAAALKDCQQTEGYWTRSLLDPAQAPGYETSGTALNTFAYAWGIRNGILDELEYGQTLERAWHYLSTVALQPDGTVGYIQPIGESASPGTTVSASNYHDFGVGAYLLAASEMSRLAVGEAVKPHLRLSGVTLVSPTEILVRFNLQPDASEAVNTANYTINGQPAEGQAVVNADATVTITLSEPLDYGRYTVAVEGIHSAEGGEMQAGQERLVVLTVPLDEPQTDITIVAQGSQTGNPHTNVNDGSLDTRWSYEGKNKWIRFDLRESKHVYAVDVAFYNGNSRVFYFKVQTSENGTKWTDATGDLTSSGLTNEMERYYFTPVDARYVRLVCSGNSTNDWNSPTEIRIRFDGSSDGIHSLTPTPSRNGGEVYDLSGRQVNNSKFKIQSSKPQRGIYIENGRKVVR